MESNIRTSVIPIAESMGVDVSKYIELLDEDDILRRIDNLFREEAVKALNVTTLPWGFYWEHVYDILEDAAVVALLEISGGEVGRYVVRAVNVKTNDDRKAIPEIRRRLVLVGKDMVSFYCDGELRGLNLSYLRILSHR